MLLGAAWSAGALLSLYGGANLGVRGLIEAAIVLVVPLYLKRPMAFVLYSVALLGGLYALGVPSGLEWFVPLFFLKLLVAHLLPERVNRPYKEEV